ncbi:MAG: DUF4105 domain-containing protein [Prevotellaceae bacterium]|nr:DUF4105 domain-containing protein [Prevotellaceae bacterium]
MRTCLFIILSVCCAAFSVNGQPLSPAARISLLTCGAGDELYASFGHSSVRVRDTVQQIDLAFNYGTFDFNDPHFYANFVRGKLNYMLHVTKFANFLFAYEAEQRWVFEQELNFTPEQRQDVFAFLINNSLPENKYYLYDFLFDNCTTRIRDLLETACGEQLALPDKPLAPPPTFRALLHPYLHTAPWSQLGIDILLGSRTDRPASPREYLFLPDFLSEAVGSAQLNGQPAVAESRYLFRPDGQPPHNAPCCTPTVLFFALLVIVGIATLARLPMKGFDAAWFLLLGLFGLFLLFMWAGTEHYVTKANFNLLWAFPAHAAVAIALLRKRRPRWVKWYFAVTFPACILLCIFWTLVPQYLNSSLIFVTLLTGLRAFAELRTKA